MCIDLQSVSQMVRYRTHVWLRANVAGNLRTSKFLFFRKDEAKNPPTNPLVNGFLLTVCSGLFGRASPQGGLLLKALSQQGRTKHPRLESPYKSVFHRTESGGKITTVKYPSPKGFSLWTNTQAPTQNLSHHLPSCGNFWPRFPPRLLARIKIPLHVTYAGTLSPWRKPPLMRMVVRSTKRAM
jgi:hypothetical protein